MDNFHYHSDEVASRLEYPQILHKFDPHEEGAKGEDHSVEAFVNSPVWAVKSLLKVNELYDLVDNDAKRSYEVYVVPEGFHVAPALFVELGYFHADKEHGES